jgi:hypothetical protein
VSQISLAISKTFTLLYSCELNALRTMLVSWPLCYGNQVA